MTRLLQKRLWRIGRAGLGSLFVIGFANMALAATTVPHTFTSGDTAKASEVNENFNALATAIDTISLTPGPKGDKGDKGDTGTTGPAGSPDTANQVRDKFFSGTSCAGNSANDIMVKVGPLCVDKYEASIWSNPDGTGTQYGYTVAPFSLTDYPGGFPDNGNWTTAVYAVSKAGVMPATDITWFQAQQACALSGKRLLTNAEWQMAAAGTPDPGAAGDGTTTCNTNTSGPVPTGSTGLCVSKWGVYDMVGNAAEWVADWIQGEKNPWAPSTGTAGTDYGGDWMYGTNPAQQGVNSTNFPAALVRGGYWVDSTAAGVFALLAHYGPPYSHYDIGFRCAR